jgi:hypothetical protein
MAVHATWEVMSVAEIQIQQQLIAFASRSTCSRSFAFNASLSQSTRSIVITHSTAALVMTAPCQTHLLANSRLGSMASTVNLLHGR